MYNACTVHGAPGGLVAGSAYSGVWQPNMCLLLGETNNEHALQRASLVESCNYCRYTGGGRGYPSRNCEPCHGS
jgi:hypothetical protein